MLGERSCTYSTQPCTTLHEGGYEITLRRVYCVVATLTSCHMDGVKGTYSAENHVAFLKVARSGCRQGEGVLLLSL